MNYQLSLLKIPVSDIPTAAAFYVDELGFTEQFVAAEYGWAQLATGDLSLALYVPGQGGGARSIGGSVDFHLALTGDTFDDLAERLLQDGHLNEDRIHAGNDGTTFIDVVDPDGNQLKIFRA